MLGNFHVFIVVYINFFQKIFQEHYQSVKRFGHSSERIMVWGQTVCKAYEQTIKVATSKERVNSNNIWDELFMYLDNMAIFLFFFFGLVLNIPVNSYGLDGTVSSPDLTFFPGQA